MLVEIIWLSTKIELTADLDLRKTDSNSFVMCDVISICLYSSVLEASPDFKIGVIE